MTTVQTLKEIGDQMGLRGTDLKDFIREQQTLEKKGKNRENMRENSKKNRDYGKQSNRIKKESKRIKK